MRRIAVRTTSAQKCESSVVSFFAAPLMASEKPKSPDGIVRTGLPFYSSSAMRGPDLNSAIYAYSPLLLYFVQEIFHFTVEKKEIGSR